MHESAWLSGTFLWLQSQNFIHDESEAALFLIQFNIEVK